MLSAQTKPDRLFKSGLGEFGKSSKVADTREYPRILGDAACQELGGDRRNAATASPCPSPPVSCSSRLGQRRGPRSPRRISISQSSAILRRGCESLKRFQIVYLSSHRHLGSLLKPDELLRGSVCATEIARWNSTAGGQPPERRAPDPPKGSFSKVNIRGEKNDKKNVVSYSLLPPDFAFYVCF